MTNTIKITKAEMIEIEKEISYLMSLDLDIGSPEDFPNAETDLLNGLVKLVNFYKKNGKN